MVSTLYRWPVILLVIAAALIWSGSSALPSSAVVAAQQPRMPPASVVLQSQEPPLPAGQRIAASDGDTVVIEGDARVRIIRRRPAFVRMIADAKQNFVVVLAENLRAYGDSPARVCDRSFAFNGLQEPWPFASRWEGAVWLEEYSSAGSHGFGGMIGIETPEGKVVFGSSGTDPTTGDDARTTVVRFQGMSGGGGRQPFDQEEVRVLALAAQNAAGAHGMPQWRGGPNGPLVPGGANEVGSGGVSWFDTGSGGIGITSEMLVSEVGPPPPFDASQPPAGGVPAGVMVPAGGVPVGAVRAGGNIATPRKIHDVEPVVPDLARSARVSGIVLLEITIGVDGVVSNARVLRSIPLLDQAALDAVRQWRYEPTVLNGQPVPVIIAVPVPFARPPQ